MYAFENAISYNGNVVLNINLTLDFTTWQMLISHQPSHLEEMAAPVYSSRENRNAKVTLCLQVDQRVGKPALAWSRDGLRVCQSSKPHETAQPLSHSLSISLYHSFTLSLSLPLPGH